MWHLFYKTLDKFGVQLRKYLKKRRKNVELENENMIHVCTKEVEYVQFKRLLDYPEITHAYTLSTNGFDIGSNTFMQNKEVLLANYEKLAKALDIDYHKIVRPYQTHTDVIKKVEKAKKEISIFEEELTNVDGLLTNQNDIFLSLGYADCIPLFFYDPVKKVVGNVHSGWKGTLQKIGQKAVKKMVAEYGCHPKDIICCIGPSIRKCHFEVEEDVYQLFKDTFSHMENIIEKAKLVEGKQKYYIDTVLINKMMLEEVGLQEENIVDSKLCTACYSHKMHSYRMSGKKAGRNTAIIGLK